jgi:hypothetical protein
MVSISMHNMYIYMVKIENYRLKMIFKGNMNESITEKMVGVPVDLIYIC